jgi:hypothetical protein
VLGGTTAVTLFKASQLTQEGFSSTTSQVSSAPYQRSSQTSSVSSQTTSASAPSGYVLVAQLSSLSGKTSAYFTHPTHGNSILLTSMGSGWPSARHARTGSARWSTSAQSCIVPAMERPLTRPTEASRGARRRLRWGSMELSCRTGRLRHRFSDQLNSTHDIHRCARTGQRGSALTKVPAASEEPCRKGRPRESAYFILPQNAPSIAKTNASANRVVVVMS